MRSARLPRARWWIDHLFKFLKGKEPIKIRFFSVSLYTFTRAHTHTCACLRGGMCRYHRKVFYMCLTRVWLIPAVLTARMGWKRERKIENQKYYTARRRFFFISVLSPSRASLLGRKSFSAPRLVTVTEHVVVPSRTRDPCYVRAILLRSRYRVLVLQTPGRRFFQEINRTLFDYNAPPYPPPDYYRCCDDAVSVDQTRRSPGIGPR